MRTRSGKRYFTEMRYRRTPKVRTGAVVRLTGPGQALVGSALPQPRVLTSALRYNRLDDVLASGWSLLGVDVGDEDWARIELAGLPPGTLIDVVLGDRVPRDRAGRVGISDADGRLQTLLEGLAGRFVLVRPDRLIAAIFTPAQAIPVAGALHRIGQCNPQPDSSELFTEGVHP
jgi:3-(3-hydroxy-phenyl)propionate hydroxylase